MAALKGVQTPTLLHAPVWKFTEADECAFLASGYGLDPDPWQYLVLQNWLATTTSWTTRTRRPKWSAGRCGLSVPRQNGKNAVLEMVELYKMVVLGRKILHTAHEVKTARKAFLRLVSFFENEREWPELAVLVASGGIRRTNGQEAVMLTNGGSCEFVARSRGSARGYTIDDLVCDEAQELTDEQLEALLPTISAAPSGNPQQIYTGTPPPPNSPGTVFARMRKQGVEGKTKDLAWVEWSTPKPKHVHDRQLWAVANPALGGRLRVDEVIGEVNQMTPEGFARERLGWWSTSSTVPPTVSSEDWDKLATTAPPTGGRVAFGVKFSRDGSRVALAAVRKSGKRLHGEVLDVRPLSEGIDWLRDAIAAVWRDLTVVVIDGKAGVGLLVAELRNEKVPDKVIVTPSVAHVITAHAMTLAAIQKGTLSHFDQTGLNDAVAHATQRKIGKDGGWGWEPIIDPGQNDQQADDADKVWEPIAGGDVTPLEAVTLALYGAMTSKRRPGERVRAVVMV